MSLDLERDFTMGVNSRREARIGCGTTVLGDAQNSARYGSKPCDPVGPGLVLHLLKYLLCCQRREQQMKTDSLIQAVILGLIIGLDYLILSSMYCDPVIKSSI